MVQVQMQTDSVVAYSWTQISGAAATITTATSASTTITGLASRYLPVPVNSNG